MKPYMLDVNRPNPHLPHNSVELQSPPPADAADDELAARNAELTIGEILREQAAPEATEQAAEQTVVPKPRLVLRRVERPEETGSICYTPSPEATEAKEARGAENARRPHHTLQSREVELAEIERVSEVFREAEPFPQEETPEARGWLHVGPVHAAAFLIGLILVFWPALALALGLLACWLTLATVLLLSSPRFAPVAGRLWQRFARRRPARAERLRALADAAALRYDALLDHLPESWAETLSLPDFSQPVAPRRSERHR
ncbi:MAG: hypothetical protein RIG84_03880 [Roseovarius sp.]